MAPQWYWLVNSTILSIIQWLLISFLCTKNNIVFKGIYCDLVEEQVPENGILGGSVLLWKSLILRVKGNFLEFPATPWANVLHIVGTNFLTQR